MFSKEKLTKVIISFTGIILCLAIVSLFLYKDQKCVFTVKNVDLKKEEIDYESFKSKDFYYNYLLPTMVEAGFNKKDSYCCEVQSKREPQQYFDGSLRQNESSVSGRFEIPKSRYVVGFTYKIGWISEGDDKPPTNGVSAGASYYYLYLSINEKTDESDGNGGSQSRIKVFSDFDSFSFDDIGSGPYSGYDPTSRIFYKKRTNLEIYDKIKEIFDDPDTKEKLILENEVKQSTVVKNHY